MEWLGPIVYLSVWVALCCYPAAGIGRAARDPRLRHWALCIWCAGCVMFGIHVFSAFGGFYQWRHAVAVAETAKQTRAATGIDSGAGLYLNYLFALLWSGDAWSWWRSPDRYRTRPLGTFLLLHAFFLFMIVQGAVIFVSGPRRWLGVLVSTAGIGAIAWVVCRESRPDRS